MLGNKSKDGKKASADVASGDHSSVKPSRKMQPIPLERGEKDFIKVKQRKRESKRDHCQCQRLLAGCNDAYSWFRRDVHHYLPVRRAFKSL